MVKIILVKQKGKKYQVFTDQVEDGIIFTEDQIVNNRIIKGALFEDKEWQKIIESLRAGQIYDKALHYLNYKMRTIFEMTTYLKELTSDELIIEEIINKLINLRMLDDERYVKLFIEESIRNGKGPILIKYQLKEKGITNSLITTMLVIYQPASQLEQATKVAVNYQKTIKTYPNRKQKEMISQKLLRSGFDYSIINQVINNLTYEEDSMDNLQKDYEQIRRKTTDKNKIIQALLQKGYDYRMINKLDFIE